MPRYYGMCLTRFKGGRKCVGRRMLAKKPEEYVRPPKCPHCGGHRWYLDKQIVKRHRKERCNCGGLHFTHRKGSRYCFHHPDHERDHSTRYARSSSYAEA